jgi:hypothetical protein
MEYILYIENFHDCCEDAGTSRGEEMRFAALFRCNDRGAAGYKRTWVWPNNSVAAIT